MATTKNDKDKIEIRAGSIASENLTQNELKLLYAYRVLYENNKTRFYERWKKVTGEDLTCLED